MGKGKVILVLKWKTVHPRKRKDPICIADINDGYLTVSVAIYHRKSWFDVDAASYYLEIEGKLVTRCHSLECSMYCAMGFVIDYLRGLKQRLEAANDKNCQTITKIDQYSKRYEALHDSDGS